MNLLLFAPEERLDEERVHITGPRIEALRRAMELNGNRTVRVGELGGRIGSGTVESIDIRSNDIGSNPGGNNDTETAILRVHLDQAPPPRLELQLVLALPRPQMLRRILRMSAELGVPDLHLLGSKRVQKSYWQTPALESAAVEERFHEGLAQAVDTVPPRLHRHPRFKPFVEDELPGLLAGRRGLVAHPGEFPPCPVGLEEPTVLLVGPEGGFIPWEVDRLMEAGCRPVSLGPRILRVENAVAVLLARLGA